MAHARGPERPAFAPRCELGKGRLGCIFSDAVIEATLGRGIPCDRWLTGGPRFWVNAASGRSLLDRLLLSGDANAEGDRGVPVVRRLSGYPVSADVF